ncbi:MAG: DedA family protein [Alphaproteobacteria bacterium]
MPLIDYILDFFKANPYIICLLLAMAVIFTEDATIITAAILAVGGNISTPMALTAIFLGIIIGETTCYMLGRFAHRNQWAKKIMAKEGMYEVIKWLQHHLILAILAARYVPGMRVAIYGAMGFYKFDIKQVILLSLTMVFIWASILFYIVHELGSQYWHNLAGSRWLIIIGFFVILMAIYYIVQHRVKQVVAEKS